MHYHHNHACSAASCGGCNDCSGVGNCSGGSDSGSNGMLVLLVIVLIVIAIFVVVGVIFGTMIGLMIFGKIIKRHAALLDKRADASTFIVADLNNPAQVAEADRQAAEGIAPLERVVVNDPQIVNTAGNVQDLPKGKGISYDVV